ncbi:UNVERIFIED_CONTAM: Cyclin-dependent kinase F-1 [Sesamum radiatum]|uniref:cyclin-dependent kinase n=1 Tax=Sesamum radiatum TaxID=300843 RepID=A0AAW2KQY0_SESRA
MEEHPPSPPSKSWSIYTRREITSKYEILERVGSGAYSDVYRARRRSDSLTVALKEVHDYQSAFGKSRHFKPSKIAPTSLSCTSTSGERIGCRVGARVLAHGFGRRDKGCQEGVGGWDPFRGGEAVDGADSAGARRVPSTTKSREDSVSEVSLGCTVNALSKPIDGKEMVATLVQLGVVPGTVLKIHPFRPRKLHYITDSIYQLVWSLIPMLRIIFDFITMKSEARILLAPVFVDGDAYNQFDEQPSSSETAFARPAEVVPPLDSQVIEERGELGSEKCGMEPYDVRINDFSGDIDEDSATHDGGTSCLATCAASDVEDPFQQTYSYEAEEGRIDGNGPLTSCVGTRWFRAPELLYGSTNYGLEIDLWSVGCIFAELLSLEPLFPGNSDIDQLGKIFSILGNLTDEVWPGCVRLPDYKIISFGKVEKPVGLEACLPNRSPDEVLLVRKLLCFDPASRATAMELLHDKYLNEEPLPIPLSELRIPSKHGIQDEDSSVEWNDYKDFDSDSDFDYFGSSHIRTTDNGFSIRFT